MPWLVWTTPWALLGLAAIPALVAIYWLRLRYRPQPVSTLLFWRHIPEMRDAGARWRELQLPLLFFLELLVLLALVAAALGVHALLSDRARPLVVILDDSLSMQAGQPSAREEAEKALRQLLQHHSFSSLRFLLAGTTPQRLGHAFREVSELEGILSAWQCREPTAVLDRAIVAAREWAGADALLLVLTDEPPKDDPGNSLQWWAFGSAQSNLAITHAVRTATAEGDRLVIEVANFSSQPQNASLILRLADTVLQTIPISLQPGETQTLHYTLSPQSELLEVLLPDDALLLDNHVWLMHTKQGPVCTHIEVAHPQLRTALEKALRATSLTVSDRAHPHLLITDRSDRRPNVTTWLVEMIVEREGEALTGPFLLDQQHPLCEGLSLRDVVWGAGRAPIEGIPIISVGSIPVLTETVRGWDRRHLRVRLVPELSTWPRSPDWPIFWANVVHWRRSHLPGPERVNARLGEVLRVRTTPLSASSSQNTEDFVLCRLPTGVEEKFPVRQSEAFIPLRHLGAHEIVLAGQRWPVAVNMLHRSESDLRSRATGRWGHWVTDDVMRQDYRNLSSFFLLAALAVLLLHGWLVYRSQPQHQGIPQRDCWKLDTK
ncbi:MAG: BatA domain-containing protein [Gemmatales bacterium]|nr:BatA domain-containing protein [Gemmatales bacterium]MDW8222780.1 BatA domain-containing protein [Gemmatales bacterium]